MLGVVEKGLDVQMSPDNVLTWYLPEVAIFHTLRRVFISLQILPQGSGGWLTKVVRLQKLRKGVGYRQRTSYTKFEIYASHGQSRIAPPPFNMRTTPLSNLSISR